MPPTRLPRHRWRAPQRCQHHRDYTYRYRLRPSFQIPLLVFISDNLTRNRVKLTCQIRQLQRNGRIRDTWVVDWFTESDPIFHPFGLNNSDHSSPLIDNDPDVCFCNSVNFQFYYLFMTFCESESVLSDSVSLGLTFFVCQISIKNMKRNFSVLSWDNQAHFIVELIRWAWLWIRLYCMIYVNNQTPCQIINVLTYWVLLKLYDDLGLGQHWMK